MEVQGRQPNEPTPAYRRFLEVRRELFQADRARLRSGREERLSEALEAGEARSSQQESSLEEVRHQGQDSLEISSLEALSPANRPERRERVAELRRLYDAGQLNQPERLEKAATGLLRGSDH